MKIRINYQKIKRKIPIVFNLKMMREYLNKNAYFVVVILKTLWKTRTAKMNISVANNVGRSISKVVKFNVHIGNVPT